MGVLCCTGVFALRGLVRTGWLMRGVEPCVAESVTDHVFLDAYVFMVLAERNGLDGREVYRGAAMALIHDVPEAYIGDLTPPLTERYGWVKRRLEEEAAEERLHTLLMKRLFREYSEASTKTARLVKLADYISDNYTG